MTPFQSSSGTIFQINFKFLFATILGFLSFLFWPKDAYGWGYGFISICLGFAASAMLIEAIKLIIKLRTRDRVLKAFLAQGAKPRSAKFANDKSLDDAGML